MGCNVETFTNNEMLESETLAPLFHLKPDAHIDHIEAWSLHQTARTDLDTFTGLARAAK